MLADDANRSPTPETVLELALIVHGLHLHLAANLATAVEEAWSDYVDLHDTILASAQAAQAHRPDPGYPHLRLVGGRAAS